MTNRFDDLKALLRTLFQLDQPDLDFGIYRIMHAKAGEITRFLDHDLLPQVRQAFEQYQPADKAVLEKELADLIAGIEKAGMDPEASPKVMALREQIKAGVDIAALEAEVYDHLYAFFRRYYSEGDFLSKRVYKPGVYAIPYEGEEVKLHWANADQYYIKTSEYLRDYAFRLRPESDTNPMRVHFRLVDAAEGEHGNIKAAAGKDRVFILTAEDPLVLEAGELVVRFEYRPATMDDWAPEARQAATAAAAKKPPDQKALLAIAAGRILAAGAEGLLPWLTELDKPHVKADGKQADYNRLEAHLNRYFKRNQFDYFIHKDLGAFLRRELDFYIKNEIMRLDDIEEESVPKVEQYLSKIRVVRKIAHKLIDFLAQLEDFQKKLWLKKKFVTETFYCIRNGVIPEAFHAEIAANDAQREEWVELLKIDTIEGDLTGVGYSEPLTVEFLKAHPTLMIDTRHFDEAFVARLMDSFANLHDVIHGLLIHGDNFHALGLLQQGYRSEIECIYIDPPYNTGDSEIPYKNEYLRSSWLTMMHSRLSLSHELLADDATLFIAIDDFEMANISKMIDSEYPDLHREMIIVNHHPQGGKASTLAHTHEYMLTCVTRSSTRTLVGRADGESQEIERRPFKRSGTAISNFRKGRPNSFYAILVDPDTHEVKGLESPPVGDDYPREPNADGLIRVYPISRIGDREVERVWRRAYESGQKLAESGKLEASTSMTIYQLLGSDERTTALFSNWVGPRYNAGTFGANLLRDIIGESNIFAYPKSLYTVADAVFSTALEEGAVVLDFFGGSGTTAHAVIHLNREDGEARRFVLVETEHYFDQVSLPRTKKIAFAPEWKNGAPTRLCSDEEADRTPSLFKVIRLESYEDALINLAVSRSPDQELLLGQGNDDGTNYLREQYTLRYMLDVETRGSQSLLNIRGFVDPTAYRLKVKIPGSDESRDVCVDLLETFNWLIGLKVQHIAAPQALEARTKLDPEKRLVLDGRLKPADPDAEGAWWFRTVTGTAPGGEKVLIIWRKLTATMERRAAGAEEDNLILNEWFTKQGYSTKDFEFDIVYVNGDNNLENLKRPDDTWKVRLIEEDFHRLMFDEGGV